MSSLIVPTSRPDLALTLVNRDGAASLALMPRVAINRMQLFDIVAPEELGAAAIPAPADRDALLLHAGAKAGMPAIPADYVGDGHIVDFIVAFMKGNTKTKAEAIFAVTVEAAGAHIPLAKAVADASSFYYGITIDPSLLGKYLALIKQPTPNKGLAAYFKSIIGDKAKMQQLIAASSDYTALARAITAHGFAISAQDLQNYLGPWIFFATVLTGLKDAGTINEAQYDARIGYAPGEYDVTGLGPDSDLTLIDGLLSASGWVTKLDGFTEYALPMQALMIPVSTIMVDGLTNQHNFAFKDLGPMMFNGFTDGLQATADGLQDFGSDVSGMF